MTHRERARIALTGGQPDFVPTFELVFHETERDFGGRTFYGGPDEPDRTGKTHREMLEHNAGLHIDIARHRRTQREDHTYRSHPASVARGGYPGGWDTGRSVGAGAYGRGDRGGG